MVPVVLQNGQEDQASVRRDGCDWEEGREKVTLGMDAECLSWVSVRDTEAMICCYEYDIFDVGSSKRSTKTTSAV